MTVSVGSQFTSELSTIRANTHLQCYYRSLLKKENKRDKVYNLSSVFLSDVRLLVTKGILCAIFKTQHDLG